MFSPGSKSILSDSVPTAVKTSGNCPQGTMSEDLLGKFNLIVVIKNLIVVLVQTEQVEAGKIERQLL